MTGKVEPLPLNAAQRELVLDAQAWLRRASRRFIAKYRGLLGRDDILQTMQIALAESARTYDPDRDVKFEAFAWPAVTGAVVDAATKEVGARQTVRGIVASAAALEKGGVGFDEDDASIAARAKELTANLAAAWALGDATEDAEPGREAAELRRLVEGAIAGLPERSRRVVTALYFEGRGMRQIAEELGVAYGTVRRDNQEALAAIRKACEEGGY